MKIMKSSGYPVKMSTNSELTALLAIEDKALDAFVDQTFILNDAVLAAGYCTSDGLDLEDPKLEESVKKVLPAYFAAKKAAEEAEAAVKSLKIKLNIK